MSSQRPDPSGDVPSSDSPSGSSSPAQEEHHVIETEAPPSHLSGILGRLGPGLIIAGSIVGSGELIATTKTGAVAGFWLLWLIVIGCVIKVFAQVEFGRFSIVTGGTAMDCMNMVPGPRLKGSWLMWFWVLMFIANMGQLGGIVGGVGQAMAISVPLTEEGRQFNQVVDSKVRLRVAQSELKTARDSSQQGLDEEALAARATRIEELEAQETALQERIDSFTDVPERGDELIWAAIISIATSFILFNGRYGVIQAFSTVLVASFTALTIVNLIGLQSIDQWAISSEELIQGLSFRLAPQKEGMAAPLVVALSAFGIIGVGASELVAYPYWCLEKGYARFTGPRDDSKAWEDRAHGWMRVMRWDAWCSMVVYTFATIAFYLLGAAILGRTGMDPGGVEMIRTLGAMYEPVFGYAAELLFLFGAFAVLYSTFFVANAGQARMASDAVRIFGLREHTEEVHRRWVRVLSFVFPLACLVAYAFFPNPAQLVLLSGVMQTIMLPMLAIAVLYFRYRHCDKRLTPGKAWDAMLWISSVGLLIAGVGLVYLKVAEKL